MGISTTLSNTNKMDSLDVLTNFFTSSPRDLFKSFHHLIFWNKYFSGKENHFSKTSLSSFSSVFEAFSLVDFVGNANSLRKNLFGKKVITFEEIKDRLLLLSDTSGSFCDSVSWLSSMMGIISISSYNASWITSVSGASLMFSFATRSIEVVRDLKNNTLSSEEKKVKFLMLVKNISLFAIGVLVFSCGWYAAAISTQVITFYSSAALLSNLAIHMILNKKL